jgi:sugar (pentulose or hexulose) kinase
MTAFAAVDLGAASGRVMVAQVADDRLDLAEVHRFANTPVTAGDTLHWDVLALYREVLDGLRAAGAGDRRPVSVGIDTWGVDYGLLDRGGALLGNPVHYRDRRTDGVMERVLDRVPAEELYRTTGLQQLPINTIYQLAASAGTPQLESARTLLMIPDLLRYWLTGQIGAERTNASTTQLYDVRRREWAGDLIAGLGLPTGLFPPLHEPGGLAGPLRPAVLDDIGLSTLDAVSVGSHDTASAVVGVPAADGRFGYISCGTWSLVGLELLRPVLSAQSRLANFSNEGGVDGTIRYLRNIMGLWLLQECLRAWGGADLRRLLDEAATVPPFGSVIDPDDPAFLPPGDMPARIADACRRAGEPVPAGPAAMVRCVLDSLALAYRSALATAQRLTGRRIEVVHLVGGGARNALLCQLTADACGLPVEAGPVESTALGNVLVQARRAGLVGPDLGSMRRLLRATQQVRRYEPGGDADRWAAAAARVDAARTD